MKDETGRPRETTGSGEETTSDQPAASSGRHVPSESGSDLLRQFEEDFRHQQRAVSNSPAWRRTRHGVRTLLIVICAVLAVIAVVPSLLDDEDRGVELDGPPDELRGTWTTEDARYSDRSMTIEPGSLTFGLGPDGRATHSIDAIYMDVEEVHRRYQLVYRSGDGDQVLDVFVYDDGVLRLSNPSAVVWRRE